MNTANVLAEVIGAVFVLVGLSVLNKKSFAELMNDLKHSKGLTWTVGVITFLAGAVSVALYSAWTADWHVVITIVGWLMLIKGAFITLFPNTSISLYGKFISKSLLVTSAVIAIVIGIVLFCFGFSAY